ncbi:MAG: T9SS type A sorting domain-containing protein [Saprospiraceae bacterium]
MYKSSLFIFLFMLVTLVSFGQFSNVTASQDVCEGQSATFSAQYATGTGTAVSFQWSVDGTTTTAITTAGTTSGSIGSTSYTVTLTSASFGAPFNADFHTITLDLSNNTPDDQGAVTITESNSGDNEAATLTVNSNPMISTPVSISTCEGEDAVFSSTISGAGTAHNYTWTKSSAGVTTNFDDDGGVTVPTGGITGTVSSTTSSDNNSGIRLVVTDENGCSATSGFVNTNLLVAAAPTITAHPDATAEFCDGSDVTLTVAANNASTYSWHDGTSEVGTSASYQASVAGTYTVTVGNAGCTAGAGAVVANSSTVSQSATLAITSQPSSPNISEAGQGGSASVSYTSGANEVVSWFLSGEALTNGSTAEGTNVSIVTGSGTSTVTFSNLAIGDVNKSVSCVVSDDCGSVSSAAVVLPVELTYFNARTSKNAVQLEWETATELNNKAFYVERSIDGIDYTEIATIEGAGTSVEPIQYRHIDNAPMKGTSYYRLRQVDFDGAVDYSEVVKVDFEGSTFVVNINPTAATNQVQVVLGQTYDDDLTVNIFDALGRNVMNTTIGAGNNVLPIDVSNFQTGQYFIKLSNNTTSITKTFFRM